MRGTGTGRHGNGARHAQRTNDPPRSCVSACSRSPAGPWCARAQPPHRQGCTRAAMCACVYVSSYARGTSRVVLPTAALCA